MTEGIRRRVSSTGKVTFAARFFSRPLDRYVSVGTFTKEKEAVVARAEAIRRERMGESALKIVERRDITLGDLTARYLSVAGVKESTKERYWYGLKAALKHFGPSTPVSQIDREAVEGYIARMGAAYAPSTVRLYHAALYNALQCAVRWGFARSNAAEHTENLPRKRASRVTLKTLTNEEHAKIVKNTHEHYRLMVDIWPSTGLRRGEMFGLRWENVDLAGGVLHIRQQLGPDRNFHSLKTDAAHRDVLIGQSVRRKLAEWKLASKPNLDDLVFTNVRGDRIDKDTFYHYIWHPAVEAAGVNYVTPHVLRHTFASWSLAAGLPLLFVSKQMGHSAPSITLDIYGHLMAQENLPSAEMLDQWRNGSGPLAVQKAVEGLQEGRASPPGPAAGG